MFLRNANRQCLVPLIKYRHYSVLAQENEYTKTPQYPPILDVNPEKKLERKREAEYEELKTVKTVEEKQIKINMSRYYGFPCYILREDHIPYNNLTLVQYTTRTHLIESERLPVFYSKVEVQCDLDKLKSDLEDAILIELEGYRRTHDLKQKDLEKHELDDLISSSLSKQINRIITNNISATYPHLVNSIVDLNSRIESVWIAGGMNPPDIIRKKRKACEWMKDKVDEPTNRFMNYIGTANLALRYDKPLLPIIPHSEAENPALTVPTFEFDPRTVGIVKKYRHLANVPGFWPGDTKPFGLLSYHKRGHILMRHFNDPQENKEAIHRQGILASFAWLNAQANFLGFTHYNDITYPLTAQTIITNGQLWSFYIYQLNTIINFGKYVQENPKRNICWATPELKLYQEIQNGKFVGFNDEVLKLLLNFYANMPQERLGVNLRPFLSEDEKVAADYEDNEKREWLEREYKFIVANRPRYRDAPEIFAWERIYKIDNKTRFMERKMKPFEFGIDPSKRRLDGRKPKYIPRALRPDLPRHKGRDAKEFWP